MSEPTLRCALPIRHDARVSPDSAWPLRRADGTRYFEPPAASPVTPLAGSSPAPGDVEAVARGNRRGRKCR